MPTGYTYELMEKNLSFKDFTMLCCRNFGVTIDMRDEPFSTQIPEKFEPSNFYKDGLDELIKKKEWWDGLSFEEKHKFLVTEKQNDLDRKATYLKKIERENEILRNMAVKVGKWYPPAKFLGIKQFMLEQIDISINDTKYYIPTQEELDYCYGNYSKEYNIRKVEEYGKWLQKEIKYYGMKNLEEIERTNSRNEFLQGLRESIEAHNEV